MGSFALKGSEVSLCVCVQFNNKNTLSVAFVFFD